MPDDLRPALLCITPAPAIDRTAHVAHIAHDEILRPVELVALPGGKGVNAARAAVRLGGRIITTGIAGGHAGRWIVEALTQEGLEPHWSFAAAESRTTYVTVDGSGESVIVYERPAPATDEEFETFLRLLEEELLPQSGRAIVAGSIPAGIDARGHAAIVEVCRRAGCPLLVDASGAGLMAALAAGPDIVKIGRIEAVEAGVVNADATAVAAATMLVDRGARLAVVTDGAREVAAANATTIWQANVPEVKAVNAVGSGDSFNAAMSLALIAGANVVAALTKGVAAGSANAMTLSAASLD
ncbi:MAG: PfkB family carbohydrate kinase, partial [Chloroflexota bacterium]|nr:PfkB family carbohydrate kinase [Chloroflexota bacterium]